MKRYSMNKFLCLNRLTICLVVMLFFGVLVQNDTVKAVEAAVTDFDVEIKPMISIAAPAELALEVTPDVAGTFTSKAVNVDVATNAMKGYELYVSSKDNTTHMKSEKNPSDAVNKITSDFAGAVTSNTMQKNAWGYSIDSTNFKAIPKKDAAVQIKSVNALPTASELKTTVHFGAKVNTDIETGDYSAYVIFTALAHENPLKPLHSISRMQQMTNSICEASTTPNRTATQLDTDGSHHGDSNYVPTTTLVDVRDGNMYTVSKLADGRCWMTQNLKIIGKTITPNDSDVTENYTIPASSISGFAENTRDISDAYLDSYGGFYSWYTATAGTGKDSMRTIGQVASSSICPKGWRLPTGGADGEFVKFREQYNSSDRLFSSPVNMTMGGHIGNGMKYRVNDLAIYWSSMVFNDVSAYTMATTPINNGLANYGFYKTYGFSVRCIAK